MSDILRQFGVQTEVVVAQLAMMPNRTEEPRERILCPNTIIISVITFVIITVAVVIVMPIKRTKKGRQLQQS